MVDRVEIPANEAGPDAPQQEEEVQQAVEQPSDEQRPDWLPE